ncbi:MAG: hypothetical protein PHP25_02320 [Candidatus Moranbacteria bacterium]|nr:hypothetical protein [Candidatus Moranbacteria bacterium]
MLWIYVPPIIFVSALIFLVVMFGKKTALLKKRGEFSNVQAESHADGSKKSEKWKNFGAFVLKFLEGTIRLIKTGIKKSEEGLSRVLHRMKEKRLGRKIPEQLSEKNDSPIYFESEDLSRDIDLVREKKNSDSVPKVMKTGFFSKEVIVKRKEEPIPQRIMPELAAEDKAKEDALIHRIAENPKDNEAYRELGDYYMSIGNIKDAKDSFKMVLKLRPRDLKAKSSLREIEMRMRLGS